MAFGVKFTSYCSEGDMKIQRCKGSRDLSPADMQRFRHIEETFRDCCLKAGYGEVRTPTVEYLHLFTAAGTLTPGTLRRVYSFLDWDGWSGERVVLRPDGTIPVARLYIEGIKSAALAKLFYITNVFMFEETGVETRERWQGGAELIGTGSAMADVELITLACQVLGKLGIGAVELRLSHVGLIRTLLEELGLSRSEQIKVFDQILDGDTAALARIKPRSPDLGRILSQLLDLKGKSSGFLHNFKALFNHELPRLETHVDDFINVVSLLDTLGYHYHIDITAGAGFEYYTGMTFQMFLNGEKIGGGGRYDALIPLLGGQNVPASGFALYLDRLMNRLPPEAMSRPLAQRVLVTIAADEPRALKPGFGIVGDLREAGYIAELDLGAREPADFGWVLEVRPAGFVLTDRLGQKRHEVQNTAEILVLLERKGADKAGAA
jgi:histidyl-tRNA synthetase